MNIFVGNVRKGTKNRELEKLFAEYGKVVSAAIARDRKSGVSRGFAFIEMANRHEGEQAIAALNECDFKGEKLHVSEAREREGRDSPRHGQAGGQGQDRFSHQVRGHKHGGWDHGARGAHTNRGQGGKRGL